ncbi:MAG: hypothetical protein JWN04_6609, partial [Myxococcaceae bacterium]|nr:hypothetical protein [Myxococcaceae bacterium]
MSPAAEKPKAYDPATTERKWYAFWEEHRLFHASSDPADKRPSYVIA